jgi:hypothetical protein
MVGQSGEAATAVSQFELIAEDRKRILGDRHRDTLLSMDGLAYWAALNGETTRAVAMYRDLYEEDDWGSGPNDERTLRFLSRLAWAQGLTDDPVGAHASYTELAERWTSLNGPECPEAHKYTRLRDYWARKMHHES